MVIELFIQVTLWVLGQGGCEEKKRWRIFSSAWCKPYLQHFQLLSENVEIPFYWWCWLRETLKLKLYFYSTICNPRSCSLSSWLQLMYSTKAKPRFLKVSKIPHTYLKNFLERCRRGKGDVKYLCLISGIFYRKLGFFSSLGTGLKEVDIKVNGQTLRD